MEQSNALASKPTKRHWLTQKRWLLPLVFLITVFLIPDHWHIPVNGASVNDWNKDTFWYEPWGSSVTHKGIDIFGKRGTPVVAATHGLVLFRGQLSKGGNAILILGPKWRLHYYAHMDSINYNSGLLVRGGTTIGLLGSTGNATDKAPHLHFSIISLLPQPWHIDSSTQGWKKMFYLNPGTYIK